MTTIYTLTDPRDSVIKYVGKSVRPEKRFIEHLKESGSYKKINWIQKLLGLGLKPIMEELDQVPTQDEDFWEIYWIAQVKSWGFDLLNHTNGGHNPPIVRKYGDDNSFKKPEVADKIMAMNHARKGKTYEELYGIERAKQLKQLKSLQNKGVSNPRYGATISTETRDKIGAANSGENNGNYGKILPEWHIEILRSTHKGKIVSDETREKIRKKRLGTKMSDETKSKITASISNENNPNFKGSVYQYDKNGILIKVWKGLFEIDIEYGKKSANICSCINGKLKTAYGFIWTRKKPE
jgi:hypothetical protein